MRITSLEIKQHEFERSFRGYNVDEVNQFLGEIAQEWDKMFNEVKMLKMQLDIAEKEASKLRDVEMTLIKTLRTAEDTSSRIAENAQLEAARKIDQAQAEATRTLETARQEATQQVEEANRKAAQVIQEAEYSGKQLVLEAENKAQDIQKTSERELAELDARYNALESRKNDLLSKLKSYHTDLAKLLDNADIPTAVEPAVSVPQQEDLHLEDNFSSGVSLPSAVNDITLESAKEEDKTDLEVIEGIGSKIKEILNDAGIHDFRTLATTPEYRLRDILAAAGPIYATHDPSTWNEQALLAENGQWDRLEELKGQLIAGRVPEAAAPTVDGANTEEMLDKVNKVKAAIRKAMVDKSQEDKPKSSSFFDSI